MSKRPAIGLTAPSPETIAAWAAAGPPKVEDMGPEYLPVREIAVIWGIKPRATRERIAQLCTIGQALRGWRIINGVATPAYKLVKETR